MEVKDLSTSITTINFKGISSGNTYKGLYNFILQNWGNIIVFVNIINDSGDECVSIANGYHMNDTETSDKIILNADFCEVTVNKNDTVIIYI